MNTSNELPAWVEDFLDYFSGTGNLTVAAEEVGVDRKEVMRLRNTDDRFAARYYAAKESAGDKLEHAVWDRAVNGWEQEVFFQGKKVGSKRMQSDVLAIFLLKGMNPQKYRDNYVAPEVKSKAEKYTDAELEKILGDNKES